MRDNFQNSLAVTLAYEGGWADHPKDPGGATMKGITLATFRRWQPKATKTQLRNISDDMVGKIYRADYWNKVNGDKLAAGVDLATFDAAVNSGPGRAKTWLMASIGGTDVETVKRLCARRLGFVQALKTWATFGRGWLNRITDVEAKGVAWALAASSSQYRVKAELAKEKDAAGAKANKQAAGAGTSGTATTAGGGDVLINPEHADQIAGYVLGGLLAAGAIVTAFLIFRSYVNKRRAAAYAQEERAAP